jgi:hypothetical protein
MAYFLDSELAALTTGSTRRIPQQRTNETAPDSRRKNKFGKRCHKCNTWVPAEKGYLGKDGGAWVVYCHTCP